MWSTQSRAKSHGSNMAEFRRDLMNETNMKRLLVNHEKTGNVLILECSAKKGVDLGEHFVGDIAEVNIVAVVDSRIREYHWIVKMPKPFQPGVLDYARMHLVHERESAFYGRVVPKIKAVSNDLTFSNYIGSKHDNGQELMALEHMGDHKFELGRGRHEGLDVHHCTLVMEWLANLHATSYIMMNTYPGGTKAFQRDHPIFRHTSEVSPPQVENMLESTKRLRFETYLRTAELLDKDNQRGYKDRIIRFCQAHNLRPDRSMYRSQGSQGFVTICHMDPWFNNMLFKYDSEGNPKQALLLDFQFASFYHPGHDLALFFLNSTTRAFRQSHLLALKGHYLRSLHNRANKLGKDLSFYTMDCLMADYKDAMALGINFSLTALPRIMCGKQDSQCNTQINYSDINSLKAFSKGEETRLAQLFENNPLIRQRLKDCLDDLIDERII